jgi:hypothetical protein
MMDLTWSLDSSEAGRGLQQNWNSFCGVKDLPLSSPISFPEKDHKR